MIHFVISANRTADGAVVYLSAEQRWTSRLAKAMSHPSKADAEPDLTRARGQQAEVCDPHLIKVKITEVGPRPMDTKQRIRAAGPEATLTALGFLGATPDARFIHRAELPGVDPPAQVDTRPLVARA